MRQNDDQGFIERRAANFLFGFCKSPMKSGGGAVAAWHCHPATT
jgi:hypothetical protein